MPGWQVEHGLRFASAEVLVVLVEEFARLVERDRCLDVDGHRHVDQDVVVPGLLDVAGAHWRDAHAGDDEADAERGAHPVATLDIDEIEQLLSGWERPRAVAGTDAADHGVGVHSCLVGGRVRRILDRGRWATRCGRRCLGECAVARREGGESCRDHQTE